MEQHGLDPQTARELAATLRNPVTFARGVLGDDLWRLQREILQALAVPHARVAVRACHSSGKTRVASAAAVWFPTVHENAIVVTTAPTWPQVELLLWGEIHEAIRRARIAYPEPNKTEWFLSKRNYAVGLSTNEGVRFQGFHQAFLLFILDEAPGVRPDIWEAIEGARAGGDVRVLALGNPTIASGPFYDAFDRDRAGWTTFRISAFDTPNLDGITLDDIRTMDADDPRLASAPRPYLTTARWVWEKWREWGQHGHPNWTSRVMGDFPPQAPDALISLTWIEQARTRATSEPTGELEAGLDVAGGGEDETVLVVRDGPTVLLERWWPQEDPRGDVLAALRPYRNRLVRVKVDSVGVGHGMMLHLRSEGLPVVGVNVGVPASDPERFGNVKAEAYWGLRERFQSGDVAGALSDEMATQLAGIRWSTNARGQIVIESKADARKRGVKSPDRAEALMLAFAKARTSGFLDFIRDEQRRAAEAAQEGMT